MLKTTESKHISWSPDQKKVIFQTRTHKGWTSPAVQSLCLGMKLIARLEIESEQSDSNLKIVFQTHSIFETLFNLTVFWKNWGQRHILRTGLILIQAFTSSDFCLFSWFENRLWLKNIVFLVVKFINWLSWLAGIYILYARAEGSDARVTTIPFKFTFPVLRFWYGEKIPHACVQSQNFFAEQFLFIWCGSFLACLA